MKTNGRTRTGRMIPTKTSRSRLHALDAARGVAILGMLLTHSLGAGYGFGFDAAATAWDQLVVVFLEVFVSGKFTALFPLMFGVGLAFQWSAAQRRGVTFARYALPRLAVLAGIGAAHGLFLFWGDVLFQYAVIGALVVAVASWRPSALLTVVGLLWFAAVVYAGATASMMQGAEAVTIFATGTYGEIQSAGALFFVARLFEPYALMVAGCVLLGYVLGRSGALYRWDAVRSMIRTAVPVVAVGAALGVWLIWDEGLSYLVGVATAPAFAVLYLGLIVAGLRNGASWLEAVGRNALSSYVLHSFVIAGVFYAYGLGLYGTLSAVEATFVGVGLGLVVVLLARHVQVGPLEWLVRLAGRGREPPAFEPSLVEFAEAARASARPREARP